MSEAAQALPRVPGFECTAYALLHGRIVWAGDAGATDHPRNLHRPWHPAAAAYETERLCCGSKLVWAGLAHHDLKGLLAWLVGRPLAFGLQPAQLRLEALRQALGRHDLNAFEAAALRLLGVGHGLTPSGDDLVGAVMFTLVYAPIKAWQPAMADLQNRLRLAATTATNPISAALLEDLMAGASYRALHDLLAALHSLDQQRIQAAVQTLLRLGATSGGDMLAGVLLTLQNLEPVPDSP